MVAQWNDNLHLDHPVRQIVLSSAQFTDRLHNSDPPAMYFSGWAADYPDPDSYLRVGLQAFTSWHHDRYFKIVEQARRTMDQTERMTLYTQAERILAEEVPILPLDYDRKHHLIKPWVRRYPRSAAARLFWKDVVIEPH
jgi:oligopeptide transport system substrate-binding protein